MKSASTVSVVVYFMASASWNSLQAQEGGGPAERGRRLNPNTTVIVDFVEGEPSHKGKEHGGPFGSGGGGGGAAGPDHSAGHYELIGGWWADMDDSNAVVDPKLTFYVDLRGFPEGSDLAIGSAFLAWEDVTEGMLIEQLVDEDVVVEFGDGVNTYSMRNLGGGGVLAATFITWNDSDGNGDVDAGEEFLEMDIVHNSIVNWAIAETNPKGRWWDVQNVAAHEIGHAFGLDHPGSSHQEDLAQTMFASAPSKETGKRSLEWDGDVPGIQDAYLGYGAVVP